MALREPQWRPDDPELLAEEVARRFVAQVATRMELRRVTKAELARRLGVSRAFVSRLLSGGPNLTIWTMTAIAHALHCELVLDFRRRRASFSLPPDFGREPPEKG